jgi:hypothetical protein
MLKHTALTIQRIQQFTNRFQKHIRTERVPLKVEVAGPVGRITYQEAQKLKYRPVTGPMVMKPVWSTFWFPRRGKTVPST